MKNREISYLSYGNTTKKVIHKRRFACEQPLKPFKIKEFSGYTPLRTGRGKRFKKGKNCRNYS